MTSEVRKRDQTEPRFRVDASARVRDPPFFCQSRAAEMQNELVEGVRLCLLLFLLISLLLLHCFLKGTSMMEAKNRI